MKKTTRKVSSSSKTKFNKKHELMLKRVAAFALSEANVATTESVPAFNSLMHTIRGTMNTVDDLRGIVNIPITGYAAAKAMAKAVLNAQSLNIMNAVYSYAVISGNQVLAAQVKTSATKLNKMDDVTLVQFTGGIIQVVSALIPAAPAPNPLSDYNVEQELIDTWTLAYQAFNDILTIPQNAIAARETLNIQIYTLINNCMFMLTNDCDALIYQFRDANLNYFNDYWCSRRLWEHHVSTQLRAHVVDELNQPIANAVISISDTELTATTDENGYCSVTHIPVGNHSVTVTTGSNVRTFGPFDFIRGHSLTQHFTTVSTVYSGSVKTTAEIVETVKS